MQKFSGVELRRRREEAHLSRAQLAVGVGRSEQMIISYELGNALPRLGVVAALASTVGCTPGDLFVDVEDGDDEALEYLHAQRRRQGFADHVTDKDALEDGARLLAPSLTETGTTGHRPTPAARRRRRQDRQAR